MARLAKLFDEFERDFAGSPISFAPKRMSVPKFVWSSPRGPFHPNRPAPPTAFVAFGNTFPASPRSPCFDTPFPRSQCSL
jgi:hypothetical protein